MRIVQPDPIYCVLHKLRRSTLTQEPAPNDNVILFLAKMCLKLYLFRPLPFRQSFLKIFKKLNLNSSEKLLWVRKFGQTIQSLLTTFVEPKWGFKQKFQSRIRNLCKCRVLKILELWFLFGGKLIFLSPAFTKPQILPRIVTKSHKRVGLDCQHHPAIYCAK